MAFDSTNKGYRALVFGASGISGWAIVNQALLYPSPNTFERVVGLTHRPLSEEDAHFPTSSRLELYSGINLSTDKEDLVGRLSKVREIDQITHVYFTAYTSHGSDAQTLKRANVEILESAVNALEVVCPKLQFFTLQTGGKAYGVEYADKITLNPPFKESAPRIPEPYQQNIFYYAQVDALSRLAASRPWKFCEIRPDGVIGFVPNSNAMNLAQGVGIFLAMYRSLEGEGATVPFPGSEQAWKAKHGDTSQDLLARFHLYASVHPEEVAGQAFNIVDEATITWADIWDGVCKYFGLTGAGPNGQLSGAAWVREHKGDWASWEEKNGLVKGVVEAVSWDFIDFLTTKATFDRQYDLSRIREIGFEETVPTVTGYHVAFDRMRAAKILP